VEEYQDINYGQQRLLELLATGKADVMAVGDDDQTIYKWRGARPNYILNEFEQVFNL
jgi:DNA helicase-2/ATP-dependent DNA helicase PcrA